MRGALYVVVLCLLASALGQSDQKPKKPMTPEEPASDNQGRGGAPAPMPLPLPYPRPHPMWTPMMEKFDFLRPDLLDESKRFRSQTHGQASDGLPLPPPLFPGLVTPDKFMDTQPESPESEDGAEQRSAPRVKNILNRVKPGSSRSRADGGRACFQPKQIGPCRGAFNRFYYNPETKNCEEFYYGGCIGNGNNFEDPELCRKTCNAKGVSKIKVPRVDVKPAAVCDLPKVIGNCQGYFPRYFYNKATKKCEAFAYGGCGGNDNNFDIAEECLGSCIDATGVVEMGNKPFTRFDSFINSQSRAAHFGL